MARSRSAAAGTVRTLPCWWWAGGRSRLGEGERGIRSHLALTSCALGEDTGACEAPAQVPCHPRRPVVSGQGTLLLSSSLASANTTLGLDDIAKRSKQDTAPRSPADTAHPSQASCPCTRSRLGPDMNSAVLGLILASPLSPGPAPLRLMAWSRVSVTRARQLLRLATPGLGLPVDPNSAGLHGEEDTGKVWGGETQRSPGWRRGALGTLRHLECITASVCPQTSPPLPEPWRPRPKEGTGLLTVCFCARWLVPQEGRVRPHLWAATLGDMVPQ